jgi:hypothetical protein
VLIILKRAIKFVKYKKREKYFIGEVYYMKSLKKVFAFLLSLFVLCSVVYPVYASESLPDNYGYTELNDNSIIIQDDEGNDIQKVTVIENENERKTVIEDLLNGKVDYIVLNKKDGSIYSSITNNTITREEQTPNVSFRSEKSYSKVYVSYAEIRSAVGVFATAGGVIGLIVAKVPGAEAIGDIMGKLSTILGAMSYGMPNDSNHGLVFTIKTVKYYRTRIGRRQVWRITKSITAVNKY